MSEAPAILPLLHLIREVAVGALLWAIIVDLIIGRSAAYDRRRTRRTAPKRSSGRQRIRSSHTDGTDTPHNIRRPVSRRPAWRASSDGTSSAHSREREPLFSYGGTRGSRRLGGPYAFVDVETTGFHPGHGDRVIEIAVLHTNSLGRVDDQYTTLLNPQGRDVGSSCVHGITNEAVHDAPRFRDVAGDILARLDGAIVVAHNAAFEEAFLATEFARADIEVPQVPALCSLWLGRRTFAAPNYKLRTLCQQAGVPFRDAHTAVGDTAALALLLPTMLERHGRPLNYKIVPPPLPMLPVNMTPPKTRPDTLLGR